MSNPRLYLRFLFAVLLTTPAILGQAGDAPAVRKAMAPMRDGVRLATDIYLPAAFDAAKNNRFPVLLCRTPYNKAGLKNDAAFLAQRGYVAIAQDCRGRFESEGDFYPFVNEGKDGYDAIEWAAEQPWSNGKVGTFGASYLAWDQYHAAMYRPPHLVAMFALVGGADFYEEFGHPGGATNLGWPVWIAGSARSSPQALANAEAAGKLAEILKTPGDWLRLHPKERAATLRDFPVHQKIYRDLYGHPSKDEYWKQKGFYTAGSHRDMKDVPILFLTGWYDYFAKGALENFTALSAAHKTVKKLLVGPWPHSTGASECGDASFGDSAAVNQRALMADWFDRWMKGSEFGLISDAPVRFFRMGGGSGERNPKGKFEHGGEWREAPAWPHPGARPIRLYVDSPGRLAESTAVTGGKAEFVFDPENPVPTIGGRFGSGWSPPCAQDQVCSPKYLGCDNSLPLNQRADVLSFATEPLKAAHDVTGRVTARLWVSSDARDTDFTAKLIDVYPGGYALIVADGQIRMRYRRNFEKPEFMQRGKVYEARIDLGSVSNLFAAGHRIRLDISSSNFPQFEPNPNTGESPDAWTKRVKARNTLYFDKTRASHVELPSIEMK